MTAIEISYELEHACKLTSYNTGVRAMYGQEVVYTYTIENEAVLNVLRTLYVSTKNHFVKQVIKTVGIAKKMSQKQLDLIVDELVNFQEITLNF
jgi:hypothetical protein